jgi:NADPH:quinone reductase-like Zn-dependent oxidoreductase
VRYTYDVVFDAVGKLNPAQGHKSIKPGGIYLNILADSGSDEKLENLLVLMELVEAGKLRPIIDRVYPLEQIVEAHRYVEQGHKKGKCCHHDGTPWQATSHPQCIARYKRNRRENHGS